MPDRFTCRRRIEFADTDMAGIVHFPAFFRFMEEAETAFWRSLGLSVFGGGSAGRIGWPKVCVSCEYLRPVTFEEMLEIEVSVAEIGRRSLRLGFEFGRYAEDFGVRGETVARGEMKMACVPMPRKTARELTAIPIPEDVRAKLEER